MSFFHSISNMFGGSRASGVYDMSEDNGRRRAPRTRKAAEEAILTQRTRDSGTATIYDLIRNDPVAAWGFAKFLDYVTVQYLSIKTEDSVFNDELEEAFSEWSAAENCDVARRNDFDAMMRIFGGAIALDGDCGLLKINGGKLQGIESDRIRATGTISAGSNYPDSVNGVIVNPDTGAATGYLLFNRGINGVGYEYNRVLSPDDLIFRGNFMRFDQVRGVPLLAPSVNTFQDAKETDEYQRLKSKNHALLGVAVTSGSGSGLNNVFAPLQAPPQDTARGAIEDGEPGSDVEDRELSAYGVYDLEAATKLELDKGDAINLLESHTPSTEYQAFNDALIRRGLLAFGLAFSFYNSEKSSYSSMKQDRAEFKFSIQRYMRQMCGVRREVTRWVLPQIIHDYGLKWTGSGNLPFEWIPQADPWLEEDKEVSSALDRIAGGLSSPQRECKRRGGDALDILRENAAYQKAVRESGVVASIGVPGGNLFNSGNMGTPSAKESKPNQEGSDNAEK